MRLSLWIPVAITALFMLFGSVFVVKEGHSAIVLNLGKVVRTDLRPGLHFKIPLLERPLVFDRRLQVLSAEPERYLTADKQDVSLDFFAVGQIVDLRAFYRSTGGDETVAVQRLSPIIKNALTGEINSRTLRQVVSGDRAQAVQDQLNLINRGAKSLGVQIVDIRIKRIDLPQDNENVIDSVYNQMRSQRQQVASQRRAEGVEQAQSIRAKADADSQILIAEAERDAQKLRGEGDAEAARIYGAAANADPGFYAFQRSLEAYRQSFRSGDAVIVLDKDDPFLQYMRSDR
ncbi:MAG: protease modulator HflC [Pseudomonadota bacterium]